MVVAARLASQRRLRLDLRGITRLPRQLDAVHLEACALVIDQRTGTELADRQEPWTLQVVAAGIVAARRARTRDVCSER